MKKLKCNRISSYELYTWCDKHYNLSWNTCCDFFHNLIGYGTIKSWDIIDLMDDMHGTFRKIHPNYPRMTRSDIKKMLREIPHGMENTVGDQARYLIVRFMAEHNVNTLEIDTR